MRKRRTRVRSKLILEYIRVYTSKLIRSIYEYMPWHEREAIHSFISARVHANANRALSPPDFACLCLCLCHCAHMPRGARRVRSRSTRRRGRVRTRCTIDRVCETWLKQALELTCRASAPDRTCCPHRRPRRRPHENRPFVFQRMDSNFQLVPVIWVCVPVPVRQQTSASASARGRRLCSRSRQCASPLAPQPQLSHCCCRCRLAPLCHRAAPLDSSL